jgi:hypothetical protein
MKTLLRALVIAALLPIGLSAVLLVPASYFAAFADYERPAILILVVLCGMAADATGFALIRQRALAQNRFLHLLGIGLLFLAGLYALASSGWLLQVDSVLGTGLGAAVADSVGFRRGWPFLLVSAIGFTGYLFVSAIVPSRHEALPPLGPPAPQTITARRKRTLQADTSAAYRIQQTRWKHPVAPESLIATTEKLIHHQPTIFFWASTSATHAYGNIAVMKTRRGLFFSTLEVVSERVKDGDFEVSDLPKRECEEFVKRAMAEVDKRKLDSASAAAGKGGAC